MGWFGVTVLFVISLSVRCADGVLCKICTEGFEDLTRCTKVGKCSAGSICYTEVNFNDAGQRIIYSGCKSRQICYTEVNYNDAGQKIIYSGCKSKQECSNLGLITKRKKRDYQVCASCCETDFCNTAVCGLAPPSGTLECLSCTNVNNPDACGAVQLCSISEQCMTEYRYIGNGRAAYTMGCESGEICKLRDQYVKNFSRRAVPKTVAGVQPMQLQIDQARELASGNAAMAKADEAVKRQITDAYAICLSCCDYSFCNIKENCHFNQEAPPASVVNGKK